LPGDHRQGDNGIAAAGEDQRSGADGLGQMAEELAVRIDRAADESPAVHAQERAILDASFGHRPHRRHTARVGLDVIDSARLRRQVAPMLVVLAFTAPPGRRSAHVEVFHRF
jgi:hypothetical protein